MTPPGHDAPPSTHPAHPGPKRDRGLAVTAGLGAFWMMLATVLAKGTTFASQILLGLILVPEHFSLFSMAAASTKLLSICQDAGIKDLLVQRGKDHYPALSGRVFWFAAVFNLWAAAFVALLAPLVALYYDRPEVRDMIWVLVLAFPLGTPGAVLSTKIRLDLRFRASSWVMMVSAIVRQGGQVCLAFAGAGAMSFVWPAVAAAAAESLMCWRLTRDEPWRRPAELKSWRTTLRETRYLILGSMANLLLDQGPYLVLQPALRALGGMTTAAADTIQGYVYWAFQMTAQIGVLLSYNMQLVLMPIFQRLKDEPDRLRAAALRSLSGLMLLGSIACVMFGALMDPVEKFVFSGKWGDASSAILIYGLFFPFRIMYGLATALQIATGRTREYFATTLIQGLVFTASALLAGAFATSASHAAWWTGGALAIIMILVTLYVLKGAGLHRRSVAWVMIRPWALAVAAGALALAADHLLGFHHILTYRQGPEGDWAPVFTARHSQQASDITDLITALGMSDAWAARTLQSVRFLTIAAVGSASFLILARYFLPDMLREAIRVAPARFAPAISRIVRVRA
ncbi:MAG: oligosaccharide flippase family protein [Phycisphaeraceae bacterium]|nr:MAG: oligosaccharide flippase family protein [Phycisphaeraceae bacterium]